MVDGEVDFVNGNMSVVKFGRWTRDIRGEISWVFSPFSLHREKSESWLELAKIEESESVGISTSGI